MEGCERVQKVLRGVDRYGGMQRVWRGVEGEEGCRVVGCRWVQRNVNGAKGSVHRGAGGCRGVLRMQSV